MRRVPVGPAGAVAAGALDDWVTLPAGDGGAGAQAANRTQARVPAAIARKREASDTGDTSGKDAAETSTAHHTVMSSSAAKPWLACRRAKCAIWVKRSNE